METKPPVEDFSLLKIQFVIANGLYRNLGLDEGDPKWSAFVKSEEFHSAVRQNMIPSHCNVLDYLIATW